MSSVLDTMFSYFGVLYNATIDTSSLADTPEKYNMLFLFISPASTAY